MCFSAPSSFIAATVLTGAGVASIKSCRSRSSYLFASMPLLFAIQQAAEGFVWLAHADQSFGVVYPLARLVFLSFALVVWPLWMPGSLLLLEEIKARFKVLLLLLSLGVLVSGYGLYCLILYHMNLAIVGGSLQYGVGYPQGLWGNLYLLAYACATVAPFFVTSLSYAKVFGLLALISLIVTYIFMLEVLVSVWCFFAAILSFLILYIVRKNQVKQ
jgi:hypothetical protein